jgi:hypothetical protein
MQISKNIENGTIVISDTFDILAPIGSSDATPYLNSIGDEYIISFTNLQNVNKFSKFIYDTLGTNSERYLLQYYRISRDGNSWSNWLELNKSIDNFPKIDPLDELFIDIKWTRMGSSNIGSIRILEYKLEGEVERNESRLGLDGLIKINPNSEKILRSPFIFKVFKINDIEIIPTVPDNILIKYRYSQDNTRTWSDWEPFTRENITTIRINPIRFFQIEYLLINDTSSNIFIQDINLIGDFQNVNKDYQKSNLFGIRECCKSNQWGYYDANGNYIPNTNLNTTGGDGLGGGPSCDSGVFAPMSDQNKANLYNPYAQNTAVKLLEKLSADAEQMLGHQVTYFATDADKKGQDHTLNEYQLYNVVCQGDLKVSIEGNNFPDSQIKMNVFDLDLFDTMEAHVTKQQFKQIFGVQRRPSKEDFLYFCQVNRMYQVDHAQQFRSFNNSAVYYKLILKKYTQKANVQAGTQEIKNQLDKLTKNSTIDSLFGFEQSQDKDSIANKQQFTPLTKEPIRLEYFAEIDKELIENSSTIISKSNYDLSTVEYRTPAVVYKNLDPILKVSDNLSLQVWFNIHNYIKDDIYNFMDIYDNNQSLGWKIELSNDRIKIYLNSTEYNFDLLGTESQSDPEALEEETWYCYVVNINQRQRNIEQYIYKRNVEEESEAASLSNTILKKVYYNKQDIEPISYIISESPKILSSDMKVTNIRLFSDIIPEEVHNKILNQYIIGDDSKYLVFADNATTRLYLPRFPINN